MNEVPYQELTYKIIGCAMVKALRHRLTNDEVGQVITYLAATGYPVGLLISFAGKSLEYRRILRPKKLDDWKKRIRRYTWLPDQQRARYHTSQ